MGFHPDAGTNLGGIIGTSDCTALIDEDLGITWYDLDAATIETYSATAAGHRKKRSALQRYDHEFGFRITVAETALAGGESVRPYRITECDSCEWVEYRTAVAGPDDTSFAIEAGHLTARVWQYLYQHCGRNATLSVAQLAAVDPAAHVDPFREQSVGTRKPDSRLADAVKRAQLRVRDGQDDTTARYQPVVSFGPLDEAAEEALAETFAARIPDLRCQADREGKSLQVFHWHHPEHSRTRKFAAVAAALDGITFDLLKWFNAEYFARTSSSIKEVAAIFGFGWAVDDPGGLAAQGMIDAARGSGPDTEAARQWCLRYNECDVTAQAVIRDALRRGD